jgi:hypothetical protein
MATNFPTSIDSYTTKVNNVDTIDAANVNDLQDAMVQVETILGASSRRRTSWTPTLTFETTAPTSITYAATTGGWYARFGSLIYMTGRVDLATLSGGSGNVNISLPVNSQTGNFDLSTITISTTGNWTTLYPAVGRIAVVGGVAGVFRLYSYAAATGITALTNSNTTSTSSVLFSGFYWHA